MTDKQSERQINIEGGVQAVVGENRGTVNQYLQDIRHEIVLITPETVYQKYTLNRRSPYQALRRFDVDKAKYFQGRKQLIKELIEAIESNNLVLVLGASGSGKSSVVRAGLIPEFLRSGSHCHNFVMTPGENPFQSLYESLLGRYKVGDDNEYHFGESSSKVEFVQLGAGNSFTKIRTTLVEQNSKWLIFIDQFEELFTRCQSLEQQRAFIDSITEIAESKEDSIKIVLAMRADFLEQFTPYPQFGRIVQRNIHLVTDMYSEELELAIKYPAMLHGVTFEPGLVPRILENIQGQAGYLPLLQYTLHLLWDYECNKKESGIEDKVLNVDSYEELGGVRGALQKHIDSIYQKLGEEEQKATKRIFLELVKLVEAEDSRLLPVSQRAYRSTFKGEVIEKMLQTFIDEKLLVSSTERLTKEALQGEEGQNIQQSATVEIAHEILLNSWSTLKEWIEESKDVLIVKSRLAEDMGRWHDMLKQDKEKANEELLTGSRLERVLELRQEGMFELREMPLKPEETQFIDASVEWRDRQLREREEQIQKLNLALTETSLREKAARVLNLLPTQPLDALVLSIQAIGENLDKMPQNILTPVQNSLNITMEQARVPICFEGYRQGVNAFNFSLKSQRIVGGSNDGTLVLWDLQGNPISQFSKIHESWIAKVEFSSDGQKIICVYGEGTLGLYNLQGMLIAKLFRAHREGISLIAFNTDNDRIVSSGIISASSDRALCLWDLQGSLISNLLNETDESWAESVVFSPDGQRIAATISEGKRRKLCLWDLQGNLIDEFFHDSERQIMSITMSPDGQMIVAGNLDGTLSLWNLQNKSESKVFKQDGGSVSSVAFSPDGQMVIAGSWDGTLHLWDLQGNAINHSFRGHRDSVESVVFSPDSQIIASGSRDRTLRLWDLKGNLINQPLQGHNNWVSSVAFSPDSKALVSTESSGGTLSTLYFWDLQGNAISQPFREHKNLVTSVAFSPDGQQIVSGSEDKTLILWNLQGEQITKPFVGHETRVEAVAFSPDGQRVASGGWGWDGKIQLWNLQGDEVTKSSVLEDEPKHENSASSVTFSPDGKIISGGLDGTLQLWDSEGNHICQLPEVHQGAINSVAFSPDGQNIVSGGWYRELHIWNSEGKHICQLPDEHQGAINSVAFSPDGEKIVTGESDRRIGLWDLQENRILELFLAHESDVRSVAFSPDGQIILSSGSDGRISLWDLQGNPIGQTFQGHENSVNSIAFSPDGQTIVSGGLDGTVRLWRGHWQTWLQVCCDRLKYHPVFNNPQTDTEKQAKATAEKYICNPQIGAKELYNKATQRIKENDFTTAIILLHHAIICYPAYTQAYYQRGKIYYQVKRYFDAIKDFNRVLTKQPNHPQVYHYRGLCYRKINNLERAQADLQQADQLYQQQGKQKEAQQIQRY